MLLSCTYSVVPLKLDQVLVEGPRCARFTRVLAFLAHLRVIPPLEAARAAPVQRVVKRLNLVARYRPRVLLRLVELVLVGFDVQRLEKLVVQLTRIRGFLLPRVRLLYGREGCGLLQATVVFVLEVQVLEVNYLVLLLAFLSIYLGQTLVDLTRAPLLKHPR